MVGDVFEFQLPFGEQGNFSGQLPAGRLFLKHWPTAAPAWTPEGVGRVLEHPLEVPALRQAVVSGDKVVIVLEADTPQADVLVAALWQVLGQAGVEPGDLLILEPATLGSRVSLDPCRLLSAEIASAIRRERHDPTVSGACTYLANSVHGARLYLSQHLVDADLVIPVGPILPDPLLGYRGGVSALYPGLSETEDLRKAIGQGHQELGPEEVRPFRQLVDEVGWLLGIQFCMGVVPGVTGQAQQILAGTPEAVFQSGRQAYQELWHVPAGKRCELVIAAVTAEAGGHTWEQIGRAVEVAQQFVEQQGRIVLLTEVAEQPGPGLRMLATMRSPKAALKPLRTERPVDVVTATRLAKAADWAQVFLLSRLPEDVVEGLFLHPVRHLSEVQRLLETDASTALFAGAQFVV